MYINMSYMKSDKFPASKAVDSLSENEVNIGSTWYSLVSFAVCHNNSLSTEQEDELSCSTAVQYQDECAVSS